MLAADKEPSEESSSKSMLTSVMNRITGHSGSNGSAEQADGKPEAPQGQPGITRQGSGSKGPAAQLQASLPPVATRYAGPCVGLLGCIHTPASCSQDIIATYSLTSFYSMAGQRVSHASS